MKKTQLYKKLPQNKIQCLACQRYCKIADSQVGFCQTRRNVNGELYALTYGILNGIQIDPIEKKPLYHFHPGTQVLSVGSYGCNYRCKQCLNSWCSWGNPAGEILRKIREIREVREIEVGEINYTSPKELVRLILDRGYPGIAFTYNEPSIWPEYVFDTAKLAKAKGLYTVFVSNGSWSKECLEYLAPVIDAVNIDIKGFYPATYAKMGAFFGDILKITELVVKKYKIFTELTTLVIPTINDSQRELTAIAKWIKNNLSPEIPWHLSRFSPELAPDVSFQQLPETPIATLQKAYETGKAVGLKHIYVWAPPDFSIGNTYCSKCDRLVIERMGWEPKLVGIEARKCKFCQRKIYLKV